MSCSTPGGLRRKLVALLTISSTSMLFCSAAQAVLIAYEPFNYPIGSSVLGQTGGVGFTGGWRIHAGGAVPGGSFTTVAGSLAHPTQPGDLPTVGNSALLTGEFGTLQPARDFPNITGGDGATTWISFIGQRQGATTTSTDNPYPRGVNVSFFDTESAANNAPRPERVSVGNSSNAAINEWSIIQEGSNGLREGAGAAFPFQDLEWAVLRIDHHGDHTVRDDFYLWLSPDPTVEPSTASANVTILGTDMAPDIQGVDASGLDFVRPFIGNVANSGATPFGVLALDELRIGTTFADMRDTAGLPEPASCVLLGLGMLAYCLRRSKR